MRFTTNGRGIDIPKAEKEILAAYKQGVNYYDTAYVYPGSEAALGEILERNGIRDKVNIATKLPQYLVGSRAALDRYFDEELKRLRTDHVDYYLMHHMTAINQWYKLEKVGIKEWISEKKASGQIRNIGFSFHGGTQRFKELIDAYDWDFAQVQFNYMDENSQAGIEGIRYAHSKGIPIIIMEPLRGGRLVNALPEKALREFEAGGKGWSPAEWGLRWIWNHEEVTVILSGMNDTAQVEENTRIADEAEAGALSQEELAVYDRVLAAINASVKVGCTGCGYCQPCPKGVDIQGCFAAYNHSYTDSYFTGMREYFMCTTLRKVRTNASLCVKCGKCEQHCPQSLKIREELVNVRRRFENPVYKIAAGGVKFVMKY
jgi:predicted aldo/keto reductase-like oxidoreductase